MTVDERRNLVPAECAVVVAVAIVSVAGAWPDRWPTVLPLFVAASMFRWWRGGTWADIWHAAPKGYASISLAVGVGGLVAALVIGTPAIEALSGRAIVWSTYPMVRGSGMNFIAVALLAGAIAAASELVFRGWLVDRIVELAPSNGTLAIMVGGLAEALVTPGDFASRLGAGIVGTGLGWMYLAGNRTVVATIPARVAFTLGAVLLEWLQVID